MAQKNGWQRTALIAGTIVAIGGAVAVGQKWAPWAPKITLAIAADNSIARLDNQLFTLIVLQDQARKDGNNESVLRLEAQIREKQRLIDEMKALKAEHK